MSIFTAEGKPEPSIYMKGAITLQEVFRCLGFGRCLIRLLSERH